LRRRRGKTEDAPVSGVGAWFVWRHEAVAVLRSGLNDGDAETVKNCLWRWAESATRIPFCE